VTTHDPAGRYAELFPDVYRLFGRRQHKGDQHVTPQGWATLQHLELAGPLTVHEMTLHLGRAQSVVSDMVSVLERAGLLRRMRDPSDRRRTLVWLTDEGIAFLQRQRDVLDRDRLAQVLSRLTPEDSEALLRGTAALLEAARASAHEQVDQSRVSPKRFSKPGRKRGR
jgi:DNA-binding MarR family transcriptional regulator